MPRICFYVSIAMSAAQKIRLGDARTAAQRVPEIRPSLRRMALPPARAMPASPRSQAQGISRSAPDSWASRARLFSPVKLHGAVRAANAGEHKSLRARIVV